MRNLLTPLLALAIGCSVQRGDVGAGVSVTVSPEQPDTTRDLRAQVRTEDDAVPFAMAWWVDGEPTGLSEAVVPSVSTRKGQVWTVRVLPTQAPWGAEPVSASVTVVNAPPVVSSVTIDPPELSAPQELRCHGTASDADGDALTWSFGWWVDGHLVAEGAELPAQVFDANAEIECRAVVSDGEAQAEGSASVVFPRLAPTIVEVELPPLLGNADAVASGRCAQDHGTSCEVVFTWTVDGVPQGVESSTLSHERFSKGQTVEVRGVAVDGAHASAPASVSRVVGNLPPEILTVGIVEPLFGHTDAVPIVTVFYYDDDLVTWSASWSVDGVVVAETDVLPHTLFAKGDLVSLVVTAFDGEVASAPSTVDAVVQNSLPEVITAELSVHVDGDMRIDLDVVVTDPDEADTPGWTVVWSVNGVEVAESGASLHEDWFGKGDLVSALVTPFDDEEVGSPVLVERVVGNRPPSVLSVEIPEPLFGHVAASLIVETMDPDDDPVDWTAIWTVNGTEVAVGRTLSPTYFKKWDVVGARVLASDGEDESEPAEVAATVQNAPPTASGVEIIPDDPFFDEPMLAVIRDFSDPDGDLPGEHDHAWYWWNEAESDWEVVGDSGAVLDSAVLEVGDLLYVEVVVRDDEGLAGSAWTSEVVEVTTWDQLRVGGEHVCTVKTDGAAWCWGADMFGQLGLGTFAYQTRPVRVLEGRRWEGIGVGFSFTCGLEDGGALSCWGLNATGQLGGGAEVGPVADEPVPVVPGKSWKKVAGGDQHACAIDAENRLWCWGSNEWGQLGNGTNTTSDTPVQVGSASDWTDIASGYGHVCGLRGAGALYCWGLNGQGQLGTGNTTNRNTPGLIASGSEFQTLGLGGYHSCAILKSGALRCWGHNVRGQVGTGGSGTNLSSVQSIGSATDWIAVQGGGFHTCGIRRDTGLYCWGSNQDRQLGDGTTTQRNSPHLIQTGSWSTVASFDTTTCALDEDSELWCWGDAAPSTIPTRIRR
jgi:alpha-tubulin suppressor-like RCC1 family protein